MHTSYWPCNYPSHLPRAVVHKSSRPSRTEKCKRVDGSLAVLLQLAQLLSGTNFWAGLSKNRAGVIKIFKPQSHFPHNRNPLDSRDPKFTGLWLARKEDMDHCSSLYDTLDIVVSIFFSVPSFPAKRKLVCATLRYPCTCKNIAPLAAVAPELLKTLNGSGLRV